MPRGRKRKFKLHFNIRTDTIRTVIALLLVLSAILMFIAILAPNYPVNEKIYSWLRRILGSVAITLPFILGLTGFLFIDKIQEVFLTEETNINKVCNDYPISFSSGTDYTNVFKEMNELDINRKTVLIILGDAENTADMNAKYEFKELAEKVKTVYWLNPVDEKVWYEFSELKDYDAYITKVFRCKTIRDIENFVKALIKI